MVGLLVNCGLWYYEPFHAQLAWSRNVREESKGGGEGHTALQCGGERFFRRPDLADLGSGVVPLENSASAGGFEN